MNYKKKTIKDMDPAGKKVLVRCDFNVPLDDNRNITDDNRIIKTLPTIENVLSRGGALILCSHMGRPQNGFEAKYSLDVVAKRLAELLDRPVAFARDVVGVEAQLMASRLQPGQVMLLENVRFEKGETENDEELAKKYAAMADIFVNDAFGAAHRSHASTEGVARFLPAVSGLLVQQELETMSMALENPKHPFVLVLGGSKVSGKIGLIDYLLQKADDILIGGGMSYTFTKARGGQIGGSICEGESLDYVLKLLDKAKSLGVRIHLPSDNLIADRVSGDAVPRLVPDGQIPEGMLGLDIGPETISSYRSVIEGAGTIIWNGPMGVFEYPPFATGTFELAKAMARSDAYTIVGGGDSASVVERLGIADCFTHVSTGGGASLAFFAGKVLPGIDCLLDA